MKIGVFVKKVMNKLKYLHCFDFMSDKMFLQLMYFNNVHEKLNLNSPKTFNEKLQWLKLYNRRPEYTTMVDKYLVKEYIKEKLGEEFIIPTLGVWNSFDEINFEQLPNQFVLKCTHDSGGLAICRDKSNFDIEAARKKIKKSLKNNYYYSSREWPYKNVKPRIIAEKYMEDFSGKCLRDYKFYCFNGEPKFLYLSEGLENHSTAHISYVNLDWTKSPFIRTDYAPFDKLPPKPVNFDKMIEFAKILSENIPFVRIDFYEINGALYFGEITFFPAGGYSQFKPDEWNKTIGDWIKLDINN